MSDSLFMMDKSTHALTRIGASGAIGRRLSGMTYDKTSNTIYAASEHLDDNSGDRLYSIDPDTGLATLIRPISPGPGWSFSEIFPATTPTPSFYGQMVYDSDRERLILRESPDSSDHKTWEYYDDDWHGVTTATALPVNDRDQMCYDQANGKVVTYLLTYGPDRRQTWTYDGTNWTQVWSELDTSVVNQPKLFYPELVFDENMGKVLCIGYPDPDGGGFQTWSWDGATWTQLSPVHSPPGANVYKYSACFDKSRNVVVAVKSYIGGSGTEVWEWDGTDWTYIPTASSDPFLLDRGEMFFEEINEKCMFLKDSSGNLYKEMWSWDGADWEYAGTPFGGDGFQSAYFPPEDKIFTFGGYQYPGPTKHHKTWVGTYGGAVWGMNDIAANPANGDLYGTGNYQSGTVGPGHGVYKVNVDAAAELLYSFPDTYQGGACSFAQDGLLYVIYEKLLYSINVATDTVHFEGILVDSEGEWPDDFPESFGAAACDSATGRFWILPEDTGNVNVYQVNLETLVVTQLGPDDDISPTGLGGSIAWA